MWSKGRCSWSDFPRPSRSGGIPCRMARGARGAVAALLVSSRGSQRCPWRSTGGWSEIGETPTPLQARQQLEHPSVSRRLMESGAPAEKRRILRPLRRKQSRTGSGKSPPSEKEGRRTSPTRLHRHQTSPRNTSLEQVESGSESNGRPLRSNHWRLEVSAASSKIGEVPTPLERRGGRSTEHEKREPPKTRTPTGPQQNLIAKIAPFLPGDGACQLAPPPWGQRCCAPQRPTREI